MGIQSGKVATQRQHMTAMLKIEGLSAGYGDLVVLDNINLEISRGEIVALIGPNGSGKSTLIRAASGIIPIIQGTIHAAGKDVGELSHMQRARQIAVVPQAISLPPAYTVREIVLLGRTPYLNFLGLTSKRDDEITERALNQVHAKELGNRRIGELSGGEQQRILLARAIAQSTPILLLDEPTTHLDLRYQEDLLGLVKKLAKSENLSILMAVHDINLAARYADKIALLVGGRLAATGSPQHVITHENLSSAYQLPVQVIPHPFLDAPLVLPESRQK